VVPVVPFSASIAIPYNYEPGWDACHLIKVTNTTLEAKYQQCLENHLYPAAQMSGSSTISYSLLGLGPPPYPREKLGTQGNTSVLVYFKGTSIEAAEYIGVFPNASLNPPGLVKIENESLRLDTNDLLAFSAVVLNTSPDLMTLIVRIAGSGLFGSNSTNNGVTWVGAGPVGCCCAATLAPNSNCIASVEALSSTGGNATQFHFMVEVLGKVGTQRFLYQQRFVLANPYTGQPNAEWAAAFMSSVNSARNGTTLHEDRSLDDFARLRFKTSVSNFTIANYGFNADYNKFFSAVGPQVGEVILFTGRYLPTQYASVLAQTAPGHWSILIDVTYTKYGYFVGDGPIVVAREPCTVTEFPSAGLNETAYLASHGCGYDIVQGPWVIIDVGN
jgi:hypothetical protein